MKCTEEYLDKCKKEKTDVKVFLVNKTMLTGKIINFDETSFVLDKCLVFIANTISIDPK
jgi:RNA chaperone Hfq